MATNGSKINFQVGFSVDKSGLSQMQSLFQQIANKAAEPANKMNAGLQQAAKTATTLDGILTKTFNTELGTLNVTKFNQELAKNGLTLKDVKANLSQVGNQGVTAFNRLSQAVLGTNQQIRQSSKALDQMFTTFKNTIRYGISSSVFNNMANSVQRAFDYSKQLDTSLNDIRIVTDKSAESMAEFAKQANEAAKGMGASTLDYTNAALIYYQQGLSDAEVQARAETTIKAANVTGQTGEEVSEQLTAVWNGYKVSAAETEAYVDKLAAVAATTAADLEELSVGMSKVASAANAMGVDFDDLNAQIATIVSVTRQAPESVGTALKTIYARLGDLKVDGGVDEFGVTLGDVSEQLDAMGIQILKDNGDLRDMSSVIAEVAEKWGTWTQAQRQAAAVAMAGKRQYNNLIALFDNWDMYTDALNTSTDALGTLQHQQDIYMESTSAKLKTLKAAWQGLYDDAINEDEVNAGIEALTNLVEVFDNFISSFGGGIKSIAGFGAIISSVFNRQIADNINAANQRIQVFKNNLELAKANAEARSVGTGGAIDPSKASATDYAVEANTKTQLEYAEKIYKVRVGLNQEQANTLVNYQKELGSLQEQLTFLKQISDQNAKKFLTEQEYTDILKEGEDAVYRIQERYDEYINETEKVKSIVKETVEEEWNIGAAKTSIISKSRLLRKEEQEALQNLLSQQKTTKDLINNEDKILKLLDSQVAKYKQSKNIAEQINNARVESVDLRGRYQNTKQEADSMIKAAESASSLTQNIVTVTSALGNMAMAWSSVNSLIDTWNNEEASFGDKITQTFMTLGMTIPIVISNIAKLNEVLGIQNGLSVIFSTKKAKEIALLNLSNTSREIEQTLLQNEAIKRGIAVSALDNETRATIKDTVAKQADKVATEQATNAQWRLNASMLANPIVQMVLALTALITAISFVIKKYEEYIQAQIDSNNKTIEKANAVQSEVDANKELYDSYDKLYNQYKNNEIEKEALYDVTDKLVEKYNLEEGYLAKLTGNYDKLTDSIRKARLEELKQAKQASKDEVGAATRNILPTGQQTKQGRRLGETYQVLLDYGMVRQGVDIQAENVLKRYVSGLTRSQNGGALTSEVDANNPQAIIKQYEEIAKAVEEMQWKMNDADRAGSEVFQNAQKYVEEMAPAIEEYKNSIQELENYDVQIILTQHNLEGIKSFEEYNQEIDSIREKLYAQFNGDSKKVNSLLNIYLSSIDNEFVKISHGLELLKNELNLSEKDFEKLLNWSSSDKQLLLSGKVEFDGLKTEEELRQALNAAKNALSEDDLTIVTSLRAKITSDKKLTKKEIEEALGEESLLAQDYSVEMADFDNQSQLNQLETLNKITNDKIEINKKYIQNAEETAKAEAEVLKIRKANWESEKRSLEGKKSATGVEFTDEDKDRLEELNSMLIDVEGEIKTLNELAENGLSFEDIDQLNFDNLISGIDGVISKADLLKDLAEKVGENWTIAAGDIENFARNFPEILSAQENYNILQDGSVQLTKQGQEEMQKVLGLKQAELEASNEAYQQELQKQADLQLATAQYYQDQADQLKEYLAGNQSAAETEMNLKQNTFDFTQKLSELTGQDNETLTNIIQENYDKAAQTNTLDAQDIYDNYVAIGTVAAASSQAFLSGNFVDPGLKPSGGGGHKTSASTFTSSARDVSSGDYLKNYTDEQIQNMVDAAEASAQKARDRAGEYLSKKLAAGSNTNAATKALQGAMSGKGGKESKSGGSSKDKDKELKKLEEEFDRYWDIHKALDLIDRDLKKLDKKQENLYGRELINSLKQENALLENQAQLYEQLAAAQEAEAAELRNKLSMSGVAFDASGAVLNYAQATAQALAEYNKAIQDYNNGLLDDAALKIHEQKYEQFKKDLERYDTLFYQEMKETQEKIEDIQRQILANNLKAWEVEVQLKLDWKQLERDWNDFIKEVTTDFKKVFKDLRVEGKNMLDDAKTYIGEEGTINTIINAVHDVTGEIDKIRSGQGSSMFESISQAQEKLKELNEQLLDSSQALHDLWEEAWDNYLEGIDQVSDAFDKLIDRFERINDELEFQGKLIELLYGDEAYKLMSKLYEGQQRNTEVQIQSLKTQVDMWKDLFNASGATMDNQMDWTTDQEKYYEQWMEAQSELNDLVIEYIELLKKDYLNTVSDTLQELEKFISGSSLSDIADEWEKISADADKYYDSVEGAYYIQTLANKIDESIAKSNNLKAQQRLMKLREKEIDYLREKENLTEYDLKAAEMRYQIALKEITLEQAQQNKTSMKLTRNEQGNWTYQYIADEEDVATKRQELLDAYNNLYQLASDAYEANLEALQELQEKYLESAKAIAEDDTLTNEEKEQKLLELREWYLEQYALLSEENQLYRNDLAASGAGLLLEIYKQDEEAYESMTENERELVDALINANISDYEELDDVIKGNYDDLGDKAKETYQEIQSKAREVMADTRRDWMSGAQTIADLWNKDGGSSVKTQVTKAYEQIEKANEKYKERVDWCAEAVERDFSEEGIVGAIQAAENETDSLRDKTVEMVETAIPYLQALKDYIDEIERAWESVQQAIMDAINLIQEYLRMMGEANAAAERQAQTAANQAAAQAAQPSSSEKGSSSGRKLSSNATVTSYTDPYGVSGTRMNISSDGKQWISYVGNDLSTLKYTTLPEKKKSSGMAGGTNYIRAYATGGYTGEWDDMSGKLAILHQKEIVLNQDDTKNFLAGINTVRELSSGVNGSIQDTIFKAVARTALELGNIQSGTVIGGATNNSTTDNVFNITAEFPNANNVDEIREAILSLPNIASQHVNSKLR